MTRVVDTAPDLDMRVLSLRQPWLWSIDTLREPEAKRIENRRWPLPEYLLGKRIAFHAGQNWDEDGIRHFIELKLDHPARRELYERSLITCVVTVLRVWHVGAGELVPDRSQRRWAFGPYAWELSDVKRLPAPIPWKGGQGLRRLPPEKILEINEQLRGAA